MGVCKYIGMIITLGPLYRADNFKGKVHWLILIAFKLLLPFYMVLVSERNEAESYRHFTKNYYRDHMRSTCLMYKYGTGPNEPQEKLSKLDDWISQFLSNTTTLALNEDDQYNNSLVENVLSLAKKIEAHQKIFSRRKTSLSDKEITEVCCNLYRKMASEKTKCLRQQGHATSALSFTCAMFYPFVANVLVAIIMIPIKSSRCIQSRLLVQGNRPSVQLTAEEMMQQTQSGFQFAADLIAYYLVILKITTIFQAVKFCTATTSCVPPYNSIQITHLVVSAQTSWLSILWNFILT